MNVLRLEDSNRSLKPLLVAYIVNLHFIKKASFNRGKYNLGHCWVYFVNYKKTFSNSTMIMILFRR
jgi:hypothetical protein